MKILKTILIIKKIEELFSYHSPVNNKRRIMKHDLANKYFQEIAVNLATIVRNPAELTTLLRELQKVRMLTNQAIVLEEEKY